MRRHGLQTYAELLRRSQEEPEWFWPAVVEDLGLDFSRGWEQVYDDSRGPEWTTWFTGATLSIARNCVHRWAEREPERDRRGLRRRGRIAAGADLRRALARRHQAGRGARPPRRRAGRPGGDLPAHEPGGRGRLARLRPRRRGAGAALLRLRGARRRAAPARLRGEGRHHRGLLVAARRASAHAGDRGGGRPRGPLGRARRHLGAGRGLGRARRGEPRRAGAARGRRRASVPAHLHVRHDREAEGGPARPGRLPRLDRARGRLPGGRPSRGRAPLLHRHGLDHGPVGRRGRRRARLHARLRRGSAGPARRPALAARRERARLGARPLAHPRPRPDPPRRAHGRPLVAPDPRDDRRAVEPRPVPLACRARGRPPLPDHQLLRGDGGGGVLPLTDAGDADQGVLAGRAGAGDGHGRRRRRRASRWSAPARSASSSAAGPSRG